MVLAKFRTLVPYPTVGHLPLIGASVSCSLMQFYSSSSSQPKYSFNSQIGSPSRVQKLIAAQPDPLLAKEIFDFASRQPGFHLSYASYHILILKLAKAKRFSLVEDLLIRLKSGGPRPISPALFSGLIKVYEEVGIADRALKTFYTMLGFNCKPQPKHLNRILEALVPHRNYIRPAFDLFRDAHRHGVSPNTKSYNIMMRAFCVNGDISIAYTIFNQMFKREILPDIESYRILMQGLCRKSQVNGAVDLLEDMLNKGYVPDALTYNTLLNSLCRKKKLREAYKLLCRMKVRGCNPDIVHYNTVILGFCREGVASDACKVVADMSSNGCLPNLVSYRTLVSGLCEQGMLDEAKKYVEEMMGKGFSPHFSVSHGVIKGLCSVGKVEEALEMVEQLLKHGETPHLETWFTVVPLVCDEEETERRRVDKGNLLSEILRVEITGDTKSVDAVGVGLDEYLIKKLRHKTRLARIT